MQWNDLLIFSAIAHTGSLSAAAKELKFSHPTLGRRLAALESSLGYALFHRRSRGYYLTEAGKELLKIVDKMTDEASHIVRLNQKVDSGLKNIKITCAEWQGEIVTAAIAPFQSQFPDTLVEIYSGNKFMDFSKNEMDIAIRNRRFEQPYVIQSELKKINYGLYIKDSLHACYLAKKNEMPTLRMSAEFELLSDVAWMSENFRDNPVCAITNAKRIHAEMCAQGLGLAVLPDVLAKRYNQLIRCATDEPIPHSDWWIGYHEEFRGDVKVKLLLEILKKEFYC